MKLKQTVRRMLVMCPDAWYIFIRSIELTAFLLLCSFVLLLHWDGHMLTGYRPYLTAMALYETGQGLLLTGAILSACIEDVQGKS